jgi:hypothetical protein
VRRRRRPENGSQTVTPYGTHLPILGTIQLIRQDRRRCRDVDWSALAGTVVGASVGICSTLLVTQLQWRHQRDSRCHELRRETYVGFLTALNKAYETLWALSWGENASELPRAGAAREILRINEVYENRQRVLITGSRPVGDACDQAFRSLKEVRDVLGLGHNTNSPAFRAADDSYRAAVLKLDTVIRIDLAIPGPDLGSVTFVRPETPSVTAEIPPRPSPSSPEAQS